MTKKTIKTDQAPKAIGTYSQAVKVDQTVYLSGQIPLSPKTMEVVSGDITTHTRVVFDNLSAVAKASGGSLADIVKLNVYLCDLNNFAVVNKVMAEYFDEPYPARAALQVSALPKGVDIEIDAIMHLA